MLLTRTQMWKLSECTGRQRVGQEHVVRWITVAHPRCATGIRDSLPSYPFLKLLDAKPSSAAFFTLTPSDVPASTPPWTPDQADGGPRGCILHLPGY